MVSATFGYRAAAAASTLPESPARLGRELHFEVTGPPNLVSFSVFWGFSVVVGLVNDLPRCS